MFLELYIIIIKEIKLELECVPDGRVVCLTDACMQFRKERVRSSVDHNQMTERVGRFDANLTVGIVQGF